MSWPAFYAGCSLHTRPTNRCVRRKEEPCCTLFAVCIWRLRWVQLSRPLRVESHFHTSKTSGQQISIRPNIAHKCRLPQGSANIQRPLQLVAFEKGERLASLSILHMET